MFVLTAHGSDAFVGIGPRYPWGGLYGGQIVAQALRAAAETISPVNDASKSVGPSELDGSRKLFSPHSIRAYFIRRGDHTEPVRYEVDRIRNGRSFITRRVVARQATGAILNAECSFQRPEASAQFQPVAMPRVPPPSRLIQDSWTGVFDRCFVPAEQIEGPQIGTGRVAAWMKVNESLPRSSASSGQFLDQCWLAYLSDDLPTDAVRASQPQSDVARENAVQARGDAVQDGVNTSEFFGTSLDHTIWFHRPHRADMWHLFDVTCHHFVAGRGLTIGHVFDEEGLHVATFAQEVLLRTRR
jgi:acyl-CoA thioesterase-2